ncbi:MAG: acetate--CoA ligase family protein [Marinibacterium sp.]
MGSLDRLLRPRSVAVIGGGDWCENVIDQCRRIGFAGEIWPVHPARSTVGGLAACSSVRGLPASPDAAFIGVNRDATVEVVADLSVRDAGGAVCFASGFAEAGAERPDGSALQERLREAAGAMAILGPNCYGFVNALDGAALWPDVHGLERCAGGVAILSQSSNLSINLTMQRRGLPIAYMITVGNQAQTGLAEIGRAVLDDPRVTALGLYIEGIRDLAGFVDLARHARRVGKPIVVLKVGASDQARAAAISHTASLAGSAAGSAALFERLGVTQVASPAALIEALKLVHVTGGVAATRIASASCSGGEAALMGDLGCAAGLTFPPLQPSQTKALRRALGPRVALANPLDYHTYIWGDVGAMAAVFGALLHGEAGLLCIVLDFPRPELSDAPDWHKVLDAADIARTGSGKPVAILASLPENLPGDVARSILARGLVPLCGFSAGLSAIAALRPVPETDVSDPWLPGAPRHVAMMTEAAAKTALSAHGMPVPAGACATGEKAAARAAQTLGYPVVLKAAGLAHKSDAGAVALNLGDEDALRAAARTLQGQDFLVERMIPGALAELLIGVVCDPAHGFVLTLGAGGVLSELISDTVSLLLPAERSEVRDALLSLRIARQLTGYRGGQPADIDAILDAVDALQRYVDANRPCLVEVEINPLICLPRGVMAADALIRKGDPA